MFRYLFLVVLVGLFGCSEGVGDNMERTIEGSWQLEATKISPGSIVESWTVVQNGEILVLNTDGSYEIQGGERPSQGTYVFDTQTLSLSSASNTSEFYVAFDNAKMILSFLGCIEECSYRYQRLD